MHTKAPAKRHQYFHSEVRGWNAVRFSLPIFATAVLFWPLLVNSQILGFRDTLHFYYPLWHMLDTRPYRDWLLPQFNYFDVVGAPIIGEPTSMIFYPPRLLLRIAGLGLEQCVGIFLAFHLCLCWYLSYWVGRIAFQRTSFAASLLASGYTFGGMTYFGIYNPPYLISSAWLPLCVGAVAVLLRTSLPKIRHFHESSPKHTMRWQLLFAVSLAAMILGGDVQTPYNIGLVIVGLLASIFASAWWNRRGWLRSTVQDISRPVKIFALPFVLGGLIAAVQLIPTYHWYRLGVQGTSATRAIGDDYTFRMFDVLTWFVPLGLGSYTPTHTRWTAAFDHAKMWTPSLHIALPIFLSILCSWALFRFARLRWLLLIATVAVVAACGDGLGLYALMTDWLPFYHFRYPIKWYAIAAFLLSVLGAYCLDLNLRSPAGHQNSLQIWLIVVGAINALVAVVILTIPDSIANVLNTIAVPADRLCGAFNFKASVEQIVVVTALTAIWSFLFAYSVRTKQHRLNGFRIALAETISLGHLVLIAWMMTTSLPQSTVAAKVKPNAVWRIADRELPLYWPEEEKRLEAEKEFCAIPRDAIESAEFQRQHVVGKLHLMTPGRSFSAQLSLTPSFYESGVSLSWMKSQTDPVSAEHGVQVLLQNEQIVLSRQDSNNPAQIALPILQDGGWELLNSNGAAIQVNQHLLSVLLPAGVKNVTLRYRTPGLTLGACISLFTLTVLVFVICRKNV